MLPGNSQSHKRLQLCHPLGRLHQPALYGFLCGRGIHFSLLPAPTSDHRQRALESCPCPWEVRCALPWTLDVQQQVERGVWRYRFQVMAASSTPAQVLSDLTPTGNVIHMKHSAPVCQQLSFMSLFSENSFCMISRKFTALDVSRFP